MEILNIITRCTRVTNLKQIFESFKYNSDKFSIKWWILFDLNSLSEIPSNILIYLKDKATIRYYESIPSDFGHQMINKTLDEIQDGLIYMLDDDNIMNPGFFKLIEDWINEDFTYGGLIFEQKIGGIDFTKLDIREVSPDNIKVGKIDMAQFCLKKEFIGENRLIENTYVADGIFIENLYNENPNKFILKNEIGCYYNYFKQIEKKDYFLPKVLVIGDMEKTPLNSFKYMDYEDTRLKTLNIDDDSEIKTIISSFRPDGILSTGDRWENYPNLGSLSLNFRRNWIHQNNIDSNTGESMFNCLTKSMLEPFYNQSPLISVFTPIHNTGDTLYRTYDSMSKQTYTNWEWVLVNDSSDGLKTLDIAKDIANKDPRVKVYDFREKSGGIVGESKYRAASLCNGIYLVELDHDDVLLPEALRYTVEAFTRFPDCKFVYSDCAEINQNHESLTYGDNFAFGYGSYRDEEFGGRIYKAVNTQNINPKTIRHIVGVPNHLRAWDRFFYHSIGGHNRKLSIADDYELIVRSFLKTKFVRIPRMLYLQFFHNSNTQNDSRADIQRRVRIISSHYNEDIKKRFEELGLEDWAYKFNPTWPTNAPSRFGNEECAANLIWYEEDTSLNYDMRHINTQTFLN